MKRVDWHEFKLKSFVKSTVTAIVLIYVMVAMSDQIPVVVMPKHEVISIGKYSVSLDMSGHKILSCPAIPGSFQGHVKFPDGSWEKAKNFEVIHPVYGKVFYPREAKLERQTAGLWTWEYKPDHFDIRLNLKYVDLYGSVQHVCNSKIRTTLFGPFRVER